MSSPFNPKDYVIFEKGFKAGQANVMKTLEPFLQHIAQLIEAVQVLTRANAEILKRLEGDEGEKPKEGASDAPG